MRKIFNIKKYPNYIRGKWNRMMKKDPYELTVVDALAEGLFLLRPSRDVIRRFVDVHIATNVADAQQGIGFDFLDTPLLAEWELVYRKTYTFSNHDKPYEKLSVNDQMIYKKRAEKYPDDGRNFCCVWKRKIHDQKSNLPSCNPV